MSTLNRPACMTGLLAVGLTLCAGTAVAGPVKTVSSGATGSVQQTGSDGVIARPDVLAVRVMSGVRRMRLEHPERRSTKAWMIGRDGRETGQAMLVRHQLVVRTLEEDSLRRAVARIGQQLPGVHVSGGVGTSGRAWVVDAVDVRQAARAAEMIGDLAFVEHVVVDSGEWIDPFAAQRALNNHVEYVRSLRAPGVASFQEVELPPSTGQRGAPDPGVALQWHLSNGVNVGADLNVNPVYLKGYTGAGVTIGFRPFGEQRLDSDHIDLSAQFRADLSQDFDTNLPDDFVTTLGAGLAAATGGNGIQGQGIAPAAEIATMIAGTPLLESNSYSWKQQDIDIKAHNVTLGRYASPDDSTAPLQVSDYVMESLINSTRFGRNRKGTIHIFSTGTDGTFPDPYNFPANGGWSTILNPGNYTSVGVSDTNFYLSGPFQIGGQVHNYPPAGYRDTFVIAGVGDDNFADPLSTIGSAVFASVYSQSFNSEWSSLAVPPAPPLLDGPSQRLFTTAPDDQFGFLAGPGSIALSGTAAAPIAAGVIALMLEANPNLTIRDIQHILVDTAVVAPVYETANPPPGYFSPPGSPVVTDASHWDTNGVFLRHSDQVGFGLIDADAAVTAAETWAGVPRLFQLDSGLVEEVDREIPTAEIAEINEFASIYTFPPPGNPLVAFCVRDNFQIEAIEVELTIQGNTGGNDLYISLNSPYGTSSNLHYPVTFNASGTTDETPGVFDSEADTVFNVQVGGQQYAFYRHRFTTYKHWDELSGGRWTVSIFDVGPEDELPEGEEGDMDAMPPEPAVDHVTSFSVPMAVPPNPARTESTLESYRIKIFATQTGEAPFFGCAPGETNCPGDLNADGKVDSQDYQLFLALYIAGDERADLDGNGIVDFFDLTAWSSSFSPGFCTTRTGATFTGGRPDPFVNPNLPTVRPI